MTIDPASLDVIRQWLQIARLGAVVIFVILGIRVMRASGDAPRRHAVNQLLLYVIGLHVLLAAAKQDAWPFSNYPMMAVDVSDLSRFQQMQVFRAVDTRGGEWQLEPNCWSPLYPQNMAAWMNVVSVKRSAQERQTAMLFLLHRAEAARQRRLRGERYFGNAALLGPVAAPDVDLLLEVPVAPFPFRGLRFYSQSWQPIVFKDDRTKLEWRLEAEVLE